MQTSLRLKKTMEYSGVAMVLLASLGLCALGFHPQFYYMAGFSFIGFYWVGIFILYTIHELIFNREQIRYGRVFRVIFIVIPLSVTLLIAFKIPLKIGFLTALPGMTRLAERSQRGENLQTNANQKCGFYTIDLTANRQCHIKDRHIFTLASDAESGFVYSTNGIDALCYNSGNCGHLFGNWYWFTED